jgi:hypothetical protein
MRIFAAFAFLFVLAGCGTTSDVRAMQGGTAPPANATILVVQPDIQLSLLTAVGMTEPRADWSQAAQQNMAASITTALRTRGHAPESFSTDGLMQGRTGQIVRLNDAVSQAILTYEYGYLTLPTHADGFSWSLGEGVQELAAASGTNARYALFIVARGAYSSSGRWVMAVLAQQPTGGGQAVRASMVDLQTGEIVWFNVAIAGQNDMREPAGAAALVTELLETAPL